MKELILSLALQFSQDFNRPLPAIEFNQAELTRYYGMAEKNDSAWVITFDSEFVRHASEGQLKTLVYHELGHVVLGLEDTKQKRHFMNPDSILKPYKKLNR
jgi:hypothetical protein